MPRHSKKNVSPTRSSSRQRTKNSVQQVQSEVKDASPLSRLSIDVSKDEDNSANGQQSSRSKRVTRAQAKMEEISECNKEPCPKSLHAHLDGANLKMSAKPEKRKRDEESCNNEQSSPPSSRSPTRSPKSKRVSNTSPMVNGFSGHRTTRKRGASPLMLQPNKRPHTESGSSHFPKNCNEVTSDILISSNENHTCKGDLDNSHDVITSVNLKINATLSAAVPNVEKKLVVDKTNVTAASSSGVTVSKINNVSEADDLKQLHKAKKIIFDDLKSEHENPGGGIEKQISNAVSSENPSNLVTELSEFLRKRPTYTGQNPLLNRDIFWKEGAESSAAPFSVVSYNILSEEEALRDASLFKWVNSDHLDIAYRHKHLLTELKYLKADIICLQEVGVKYYNQSLCPALSKMGYQGGLIARNECNDAIATFVRKDRFSNITFDGERITKLVCDELNELSCHWGEQRHAILDFTKQPEVLLLTQVTCSVSGKCLVIGNTHLAVQPDLQCLQAMVTLRHLCKIADNGPMLLCGDFNSAKDTPVYQLMSEGYPNDDTIEKLMNLKNVYLKDKRISKSLIDLWWQAFKHTAVNMHSAYKSVTNEEPVSALSCHEHVYRSMDYIWFTSDQLDPCSVLKTIPQETLEMMNHLPNSKIPSDHLSLKAELAFISPSVPVC